MKKTFLYTSIVIGLALAGCSKSTRTSTAANDPRTTPDYSTTSTAGTTATDRTVGERVDTASRNAASDISRAADSTGDALERAGKRTANAMSNMAHDVSARVTEWKLSNTDLQADIDAKRDIVRTKTSAGAPTGKVDKSALKSSVESRVHGDSQLAPFKLDVEIDHQTEVVLTGKARTADEIGRAIAVALDTEGVTKVTSKIKLDKNAGS
ncbi:MAG: hypothetical protein RIQ93_1569 [Verrucomicrobiota bacterium]|jgi:osmotically-inducible protein OsmY